MSDDQKPKHLKIVSTGGANVTDINHPYREEIRDLLTAVLENHGDIESLMIGYTLSNGDSAVLFSSMSGGSAAWLVRLADAIFMENFMYQRGDE